mmetsp:Transcript_65505/g.173564  ORF Transcript_65505/g.173564 Transcript_65505/m.173564 type:complete len:222 (-) Transcript_65505:1208-1873(-)
MRKLCTSAVTSSRRLFASALFLPSRSVASARSSFASESSRSSRSITKVSALCVRIWPERKARPSVNSSKVKSPSLLTSMSSQTSRRRCIPRFVPAGSAKRRFKRSRIFPPLFVVLSTAFSTWAFLSRKVGSSSAKQSLVSSSSPRRSSSVLESVRLMRFRTIIVVPTTLRPLSAEEGDDSFTGTSGDVMEVTMGLCSDIKAMNKSWSSLQVLRHSSCSMAR